MFEANNSGDRRRNRRQGASRPEGRMRRIRVPSEEKIERYRATVRRAIEEYVRHLSESASAHRIALINNSSPIFFGFAMQKFFSLSEHNVRIYSNYLSRFSRQAHGSFLRELVKIGEPVWANPEISDAAKKFLQREDSLLELIVRNRLDVPDPLVSPLEHEFLKAIVEEPSRKGTITIRIVGAGRAGSKIVLFPANFVVVDEEIYRSELDEDSIRAVVQFGKDGRAKRLAAMFAIMAKSIDEAANTTVSQSNLPPVSLRYGPEAKKLLSPSISVPPLRSIDWDNYQANITLPSDRITFREWATEPA